LHFVSCLSVEPQIAIVDIVSESLIVTWKYSVVNTVIESLVLHNSRKAVHRNCFDEIHIKV
jgi:hypothetical protein